MCEGAGEAGPRQGGGGLRAPYCIRINYFL